MLEMTDYHMRGKFKALSNLPIVRVTFAFVNFLAPYDATPDLVPALGIIDDASLPTVYIENQEKTWREFSLGNKAT